MSSVSPSDDPVDAIDQYNLGVRYTNGDNATQDDVLAAIWYRKSAEQGHAEAQCDLGVSYVHGSGVPQSFEMALKWFRKAAEQGECAAEHNLGVLYAAGKGVTKNLEVAAAWYSKAADQGHIKAKLKFQHLLDSGIRPASPELLKGIDPETLNGDLKKELQIRKSAVARRDLPPEMPKGDTIPCPTCGVKIARHILKSHQREYHRPLPNLNQPRQPKKPITKSTCPALPLPSVELDYPVRNTVGSLALCPRCSGDGGVRAGCRKCGGTGWVPKEMERDLVFRPDQHVAENSRISNSDYLGGNDGAHFREMDGRIGTIPMFDDYGEES